MFVESTFWPTFNPRAERTRDAPSGVEILTSNFSRFR